LLCEIVFSHGTDTLAILTCQIQGCQADDPQQQDQHERPKQHMPLVAWIHDYPSAALSHFYILTSVLRNQPSSEQRADGIFLVPL
jgi:hypothetical protein